MGARECAIDGHDQVLALVRGISRKQFHHGGKLIGEMMVRFIVAMVEERNRQHRVACNQRENQEHNDLAADAVRQPRSHVESHDASTFAANR